jgi:DNA-binding NarL/FixJ family response regulator
VKPKDRPRQLSIEQLKTIELLSQGQSAHTVAESVGVSNQTICVGKAMIRSL